MTLSTSSFKSLAWKAVVWASIFVLANTLAREPVQRLVEAPARQQMLEISRTSAPVVVLGDSHAAVLGFSDSRLLNLARGGDSFAEMRAKLDYLLRHGPKPRRVVLSVSWHSFSKGRVVRNNRQQGELFCDDRAYSQIYEESAGSFRLRMSLFRLFPLLNPVNARLSRRYLLHRFFPSDDRDRWSGASQEERDEMAKRRLAVQYQPPYDPNQFRQLQAIVELCREQEIEVAAIRMPLSPDYFRQVLQTDEYREGEIALRNLGLKVRDWNTVKINLKEFDNQDHLVRYSPTARKIRDSLLMPSL